MMKLRPDEIYNLKLEGLAPDASRLYVTYCPGVGLSGYDVILCYAVDFDVRAAVDAPLPNSRHRYGSTVRTIRTANEGLIARSAAILFSERTHVPFLEME
jgi:hypothetical protein